MDYDETCMVNLFFLYECFQIIVVFIHYYCACGVYSPLEFYFTCVLRLVCSILCKHVTLETNLVLIYHVIDSFL